jgi:hypothetical protein
MRDNSSRPGSVALAITLTACLTLAVAPDRTARAQAAAEVGTIAGVVLDKSTGDPIIEAGVEVMGTGKTVRTDLDGRYTVKLPPGSYQVRIFAPLYQGTRLENVAVRAGAVTKADATLIPGDKAGVEVVEVVAQASRAAEATQLLRRQKSATVSDNVSAETIAKTPDSDAAEVVQRVPAVTVKDDKFVVVRGLAERYNAALLNRSRLPSPDPNRRVVPLDLFPADFIEGLSIVKSYTPDLPGDFAGGLIDIDLREFPEQLTLGVGLSGGANTATTFQDFITYQGSRLDYLGFGDGFRELPSTIPGSNIGSPPVAAQRRYARSLKNIWNVDTETAPPNFGVDFSVGNSIGPLGFDFAAIYGNEYKTRRGEIQRQFLNSNTPTDPVIEVRDDIVEDQSTFETRLGGLFTSALKITPEHKLSLRTLINHSSFDNTLVASGTTNQNPDDISNFTRLAYVEEQLGYGQLSGEHRLPWLEIDWRTAAAQTTQDVPDTRNLTYIGAPGTAPSFVNDSSGGLRLFSNLTEFMTDSAVDFTVPFLTRLPFTDAWTGLPAKFKFGPAYTFRDRDFTLRRFRYQQTGGGLDLTLPPEILLDPRNIGNGMSFIEQTQPRDAFSATEEIIGGYGMFELPLVRDRLRFIAGVRMEYSLIRLETFDEAGNPSSPHKKNIDPLPGANLVYSPRSDMNVRLAYSRTVSRPDFRELSPTVYPEPTFLRPIVGNPALVETKIESYELRWEWFLSPSEVVSAGVFFKELRDPIELTVVVGASDLRDFYQNAEKADLLGIELEGRKNLGFLHRRLANVGVALNVAWIDSTVEVGPASGLEVQTSADRALQGQSPFVVNAGIDYTHPRFGTVRLLYNTAGSRLSRVGAFGLPDIFEERRDQLDAVVLVPLNELIDLPLTAKLGIENILNDQYEYTQADRTQVRYTAGTKFTVGISYSF